MTEARWDEYLVAEHELIERAMAVLEAELHKLKDNKADLFRVSRSIDFLLEFGDKLHNKKEEEQLFPLMETHGIPRGGPIGVMLAEHQMERDLLTSMQPQLASLSSAEQSVRDAFVAQALDYLQVRANHIWKENDVLYAMGRRVFDDDKNTLLVNAFTAIDLETYGPDARSHFVAMVEEMEKGSTSQKKLIENLNYAQINAIMEALPVEVTFVDANDQVAYFNRLDREKIFVRTRSVIGRKVEKCHPQKSVHMVQKIVQGFKDGTREDAEFWIDFNDDKVLIRYYPVRDDAGQYLGVLEITQNIAAIQKMQGQKLLLDS